MDSCIVSELQSTLVKISNYQTINVARPHSIELAHSLEQETIITW